MPLGEEHGSSLLVEVNGQQLPPDVMATLVHGYVDDSSNVPDMFVLRFTDEHATVLTEGSFTIGAPVRLLVQSTGPGGPELLLTGEVTTVESEVSTHGLHTVVRGLDKSHRLFRGRRVEAYVQCTASDIARKVASRASLQPGKIDAGGPVLKHVTQDGVTDWEFLRRLAFESGFTVAVVDGKLNFGKPTPAGEAPSGSQGSREDPLVLERGVNLTTLRATVTSAEQVSEVEVRGWDMSIKDKLVAVAPAATVSAELADVTPVALAQKFSSPRFISPIATFDQQKQVDAAAKSLSEHLAGGFAELEGTARGNPKMRAGTAVALANVGKPFDGRYTLSGTRHEFSPDQGYLTSFVVSNESERSLYGLAAGGYGATDAPLSGVVSAIVTDVNDPDQLGRVRVRFPVLSDTYESWWARVVQLGAGPKRGTVWLPEINDEVLVAFSQDSMQQPFVIGGLYNGKDKADSAWEDLVDATDGKLKRRAIVSRTGMLVEFLESREGEQINVSTNNGAQRISLVQKNDKAIQVISEGPVEVTAKNDITLTTANGNVSIKGQTVSLEATSDLELTGMNVKVTGKTSAETKAPTVKVAGDMEAEVSGGATTTIKGGLVRIN